MNRPPDEQLSRLLPFEVESFVFRTAKLLIKARTFSTWNVTYENLRNETFFPVQLRREKLTQTTPSLRRLLPSHSPLTVEAPEGEEGSSDVRTEVTRNMREGGVGRFTKRRLSFHVGGGERSSRVCAPAEMANSVNLPNEVPS
ncbi:MAG: hypothetical protein ACTS6A_02010 [Candidatus Hodgkinia cicadicola]